MISIIASALEIVGLLIKSLFKCKKRKNEQKSFKELSTSTARPGSETSLRPEESKRSSQGPRKRRKSVTETVTRTIVVETEGSSSPDSSEKTII